MRKKQRVVAALMLAMKLTIMHIVLIALSGNLIFASDAVSQKMLENRFSLSVEHVKLNNLLTSVQKAAKVKFYYSPSSINGEKFVSYSAADKRVYDFIQEFLVPIGIGYEIVNDQIVLVKIKPTTEVKNKSIFSEEALFNENVAERILMTGVVKDEKGLPIEGATISEKGTTNKTVTNSKGEFKLKVKDAKSALQITHIGFNEQIVFVQNNKSLNITLSVSTKNLEDVVVVSVGYGTVRKSDLTGSVAKISTNGSETAPTISIDQFMQGRVSGVQLTSNSGAPGSSMSFLIRGASSISGSSQPLIILDGFPVETGEDALTANRSSDGWSSTSPAANPLAAINPNDIESIEVLKDASSTAIYGSRGANGVVIITTKKGKLRKDVVNYNYRTDFSKIPKQIKLLNTAEFIAYANEANKNSGLDSAFKWDQIETNLKTDNNWQDLIYQTAISSEHQLSVSGGEDKMKYLLSANYADQVGIVKNSNFKRGSFRANIERQLSQKIKITTSFSGSLNMNLSAQQNSSNGNPAGSIVSGALTYRPSAAPFINGDESDPNIALSGNPLTLIQKAKNLARSEVYLLNIKGEYKISKAFTFLVNGGYNSTSSTRQAYLPKGTFQGDLQNGVGYYGENKNSNYLLENTLSFSKVFASEHRINTVVGYTWQEWTNKSFGVQASNFSTQDLGYNNLGLANSSTIPTNSYQQWGLSSFLGRINYVYDNRYLITFTNRADGASRLAVGNKWAYFPSAAIGWNFHNESFFPKQKIVKELKLRASYGIVGNQNVGIGSDIDRFGSNRTVLGGNIVNGISQSGLGNPTLKWELTNQYNIGVDVTILGGIIKYSIEYYNRNTNDLLINLPLAASNGFTSYATNGGSLTNKGIEFDFTAKVPTKKLSWVISGNISSNFNKVTNIKDVSIIIGKNYFGGINSINQPINAAIVGQPIGVFYGYITDGVYQNLDEITKGPIPIGKPKPGDIRFKDVNNDGIITSDDRTILGSPFPKYTFGLTNEFTYQRFGFSFFIMGSIGQKIANLNRFQLANLNYLSGTNILKEAWDKRWTGEGTSNYYPAPRAAQTDSYQNLSNFLVEDGSFVRLKNITLSYNMNVKVIKFIKTAKAFVSATNVLTFTNYKGYDPEVSANANSTLNGGVDTGTIPQYRTVSMGINVSL